MLQRQHVEVSRATQPFTALLPAPRPRPENTANADTAQARSTDTLATRPRLESREFPAGTYIVRAGQPYGLLAFYLLEPENDDGLLAWGFFEGMVGTASKYPVIRVTQPVTLRTTTAK